MFTVEFVRDTELNIDRPPHGIYFEKGETIDAEKWERHADMVHIETLDYGELIIFIEDIEIWKKTQVHP